jgi:Big-like domain-containing protein
MMRTTCCPILNAISCIKMRAVISRRRSTRTLTVAVAITALACGDGSGPTAHVAVARVDILPDTGQLLPGQTRQLSAAAYSSAGTLISAPAATWQVDDETVARVSSAGLLNAIAPGQATVSVTVSGISATGTYDIRLLGTYALRAANGLGVPAVASRDVACPPSSTAPGTETVDSGSLRFTEPTPGLASPQWLAVGELTVIEDCGNSRSTYYGGAFSQPYRVKSGIITFGTELGFPFRQARLSHDTITVRWKPELSDSITFTYVKQ